MDATTQKQQQAQLERLQAELSTRQSTLLFARAGVATMVGLIFGGASVKLFIDSAKVPYLGFVATAVALGLFAFAAVSFARGRRALRQELARFEELKALRRALRLDDPSALLPR